MNELTTKQFSDLIENKLKELEETVTLGELSSESEFPCRKIGTPLETTIKTSNAIPILKQFQITVSHYHESLEQCMEMVSTTDEKLREYSLIRITTSQITYDEKTKKYNLIVIYEVRWEALTNSFVSTK